MLAVFSVLAAIVLIAALVVVMARNPVTSALALLVALLGVSALYALAGSGFLAVVQVLIYAGAVVTLFIFVVMLLNLRGDELDESGLSFQRMAGVVLTALLLGNLLAVAALNGRLPIPTTLPPPTTVDEIARLVFGRYAVAFELTSVLLLAAVVGVVTLARRERT